MKTYQVIFIDRKTGLETIADYKVSLDPMEVIQKQIENSTVKTIVCYKEVKND